MTVEGFNPEYVWPARNTLEGQAIPLETRLNVFIQLLEYLARKSPSYAGENNQRHITATRNIEVHSLANQLGYFLDNHAAVLRGSSLKETDLVNNCAAMMFDGDDALPDLLLKKIRHLNIIAGVDLMLLLNHSQRGMRVRPSI